jgi:2'-5' RNA ligase
MRLFVAIDLPPDVKQAIVKEQQRIVAALASVRLVKPEQMHVTLAFFGEVPDARVPSVVETINLDVEMPPFDIVFGGAGVFPPRGAPRALWMGVAEGAEHLVALQAVLAGRVAALGIGCESRAYRPHLTLARWRESRSSDRRTIETASVPAAIAAARVDHTTLYQSRLSSAGPQYTALARATLNGSGD